MDSKVKEGMLWVTCSWLALMLVVWGISGAVGYRKGYKDAIEGKSDKFNSYEYNFREEEVGEDGNYTGIGTGLEEIQGTAAGDLWKARGYNQKGQPGSKDI